MSTGGKASRVTRDELNRSIGAALTSAGRAKKSRKITDENERNAMEKGNVLFVVPNVENFDAMVPKQSLDENTIEAEARRKSFGLN